MDPPCSRPSQPESWSGGYQSAKAVGAGIGGYEELAIQIENRKHETRFVDLERVAGRNLGRAARQRTSLCRAGADPIRHHPVHRLVIGVPRFLL
jgi:hypothetical protein